MMKFDTEQWIDERFVFTMGGGGQQQGNTTTVQKADPWSGQQPYLIGGTNSSGATVPGIYNQAASLYGDGSGGPQYYPTSTVAGRSSDTTQGLANEAQYGLNGSPVTGAASASATNLLNPDFLSSSPGSQQLSNISQNYNPALGLAGYQAAYAPGSDVMRGISLNGGPTYNQQALGGYANGDRVNNDPYLNAQWQAMSGNITDAYQTAIAPGITGQMEAAGRFGSGSAINAQAQGERQLASQLSDAGANLLQQNYQQQTQNQINAANAITQGMQAQQGIQLNAAGAYGQDSLAANQNYANMYNSGAQTQAAAANYLGSNYGNLAGTQSRALFAAPTVSTMPLTQIAALQDAGTQQDAYQQALLNDQVARYNYQQMLPYNNLSMYAGMIQGGGSPGGSATSSTPYYQPKSGGLGGALGGAASGAMMGSAFGPYGSLIGGIGGALYGGLS